MFVFYSNHAPREFLWSLERSGSPGSGSSSRRPFPISVVNGVRIPSQLRGQRRIHTCFPGCVHMYFEYTTYGVGGQGVIKHRYQRKR